MGGPPSQAQRPVGPPGHGAPTGMTQGNLPPMTMSTGQLPPHNTRNGSTGQLPPHGICNGFGHGARPLQSGTVTPGHGAPLQSSAALHCAQSAHFPPGYGPNCRPLPSSQIPPGHGGHAVSYTPPAAAAQMQPPVARPPAKKLNVVCKENSGSLPMDSCLWAGIFSSPTPARSSGAPTPTDRSMTNGFKDSTDYVDAGYDSEVEFASSRSMPPPRRQADGDSDRRSHRQRDEASCMPCGVCSKCF